MAFQLQQFGAEGWILPQFELSGKINRYTYIVWFGITINLLQFGTQSRIHTLIKFVLYNGHSAQVVFGETNPAAVRFFMIDTLLQFGLV
jgi:hypothetical protein